MFSPSIFLTVVDIQTELQENIRVQVALRVSIKPSDNGVFWKLSFTIESPF